MFQNREFSGFKDIENEKTNPEGNSCKETEKRE